MPGWELTAYQQELPRARARRDLLELSIVTFPHWSGQAPGAVPAWIEEGNAARERFRAMLLKLAGLLDANTDERGRVVVDVKEIRPFLEDAGFLIGS